MPDPTLTTGPKAALADDPRLAEIAAKVGADRISHAYARDGMLVIVLNRPDPAPAIDPAAELLSRWAEERRASRERQAA